mgnify:FL=1
MRGKDVNPNDSWLGYGPGSLSARARQRRTEHFLDQFPQLSEMTVVDLGGTSSFWAAMPVMPASVTVVNLDPRAGDPERGIRCVVADACTYEGAPVDLVVSNSLIEHVGGVGPRTQLADTIRRLAARYWIQTPYRYFPIEPHWMFPGMQFLPLNVRARLARRHWTVGTHMDPAYAIEQVRWTELIGMSEMRELFPEAEIWKERVAGLIKSIVAVKPDA